MLPKAGDQLTWLAAVFRTFVTLEKDDLAKFFTEYGLGNTIFDNRMFNELLILQEIANVQNFWQKKHCDDQYSAS